MPADDTQKTRAVKPAKRRKRRSSAPAPAPAPAPALAPAPAPVVSAARVWAGRVVVPVFGALPLLFASAVKYGDSVPADVWAAIFVGLGGVLGALAKWLLGERRP